jgi:Phage tail protein (Tail_P2_I)
MANNTEALAQRLYERLPEIYRTRDLAVAQQRAPAADESIVLSSRPLLALISAIATQVASLRQDMDDLWDNFFIDTCDDWAIPYIGALLSTNLLPNELGSSQRLDVRNTVAWRRSKGTPAMLASVARAATGWGCEVAEFFSSELWVENLRHLRMARPITPSLHDRFALSRLGHADDPFLHSPDVRRPPDLGEPMAVAGLAGGHTGAQRRPLTAGVGRSAMGTTGRYGLKDLGVFVRRLPTFRVAGVTPAPEVPAGPDGTPDPDPSHVTSYTFDPLGRDVPLFSATTGAPVDRAQLDHAPAGYFGPADGSDLAVRQLGIPLAVAGAVVATPPRSGNAFSFSANPPLQLHPLEGMRLLQPHAFELAGQSFIVSAMWRPIDGSDDGSDDLWLGGVSTLLSRLGRFDAAFHAASSGTGLGGQLLIKIEVAEPTMGWPELVDGRTARFRENVLAIRDDVPVPRAVATGTESAYQDALLVYLPSVLVTPGHPVELWVADDGATYSNPDMITRTYLARAAEGQLWPPANLSRPSLARALIGPGLHRVGGLALPDPGRFDAEKPVRIEACIATGPELDVIQEEGGLATATVAADALPLNVYPPDEPWQPLEFHASRNALSGQMPTDGLRVIKVTALKLPSFSPQFEIVITDRAGSSLLCYVPETTFSDVHLNATYVVHDDGSTYTLSGGLETLARVGAGQVVPIEGTYPLRRRVVISGRRPAAGELAIDPERGRFEFAADDPVVVDQGMESRHLTVDYVEAFADDIGARAFSRGIDYITDPPTRIVSASGDAATYLPLSRIHRTLQDAVDQASDGDVIEIADSATYVESLNVGANASTLTIRAADQPLFARPCLKSGGGSAISVLSTGRLELSGLLISGGSLNIPNNLSELLVTACTFEVASPDNVSLQADDPDSNHRARYLICRSLLGSIRVGQGVDQVLVADSVVDNAGGLAIGASQGESIEADLPARSVQLERVTVLGRVRCESLVASESILAGAVWVDDRQSGCLRFSRFDPVSTTHLPRRYRCVTDTPTFASLIQWRPAYGQLSAIAPATLVTASETGDIIGSFASTRTGARFSNLKAKLLEFLPVGLVPLVIAET